MATMIEIEYPKDVDYLTKRFIERWAERQGGASACRTGKENT